MRVTVDDWTASEIDKILSLCKDCSNQDCERYKSRKEVVRAALMVFGNMPCSYSPKGVSE